MSMIGSEIASESNYESSIGVFLPWGRVLSPMMMESQCHLYLYQVSAVRNDTSEHCVNIISMYLPTVWFLPVGYRGRVSVLPDSSYVIVR